MTQQQLFNWDVVRAEINKNTGSRLNWKELIGMSLTRACARCRKAGLSAEQTYDILCFEHPDWDFEIKRRLHIGVCARFGEMGTVEGEVDV